MATDGRDYWLLNRHQSAALAVLGIVLAACLLGRTAIRLQSSPLTEEHRAAAVLDLNQASAAEMQLVPGIGEALAERVLLLRHQRGGFRTLEELRDVNGIGLIKLQQMRPYVTLAPEPDRE